MSEEESGTLSRRQFLAGCGAAGAAVAGAPAIADAAQNGQPDAPPSSLQSFGAGGYISIEGREAIAEVDRRFAQQRPQIQQTVRAVEDLGLDPSGQVSVSGTLESELSGMANTRIVFPGDGTFLLSEQVTAQPDGPIEFVGNGCSFVIPPNTEMRSFVFVLPSGSLINNIVIDQSAPGAIQEFSVQTEGVVRADNVTVKGYIPAHTSSSNIDATFSPIARTEGAVVRATNYTAVGGTAAGIHDEADLPPSAPENRLGGSIGIWVGQSTQGTIQLVNPTLSGWSNGIYGGRTTGRVEVRGGTFVNNWNCQTRIGGGSVVDGASMLLDDRQWSDKGPFKIGHQGVYAARVDAKHGNTTDPARFVNLDVRAMSMREGASLFDWESVSGPGIIQNCRITNHLDRPVILGESPSVSGPTNIMVDQCLITGSSSGTVMECHDRPQSRVQWTCIQLPDAGPEDIQGAQIGQGVSFGPQCMTGSGLAAPKKVGSGGNISSLPAPTNPSGPSGPGPDNPAREGPSKGVFVAVIDGIFMVLLLLLGMVVLFVAGILGALGALAGMIGGD